MTFVRLAGCNAPEFGLDCVRWCDTPASWGVRAAGEWQPGVATGPAAGGPSRTATRPRTERPSDVAVRTGAELQPAEILDRARFSRLCLTGGEPLLQAEGVASLVAEAHRRGMKVHLETNGTLDPPTEAGEPIFDWAVVSPKPPGYLVAPGWEGLVDELKLVADEWLEAAVAERVAARHPEAVVCIQPEWEGRPLSLGGEAIEVGGPGRSERRAIELVMDHPDWRLSLQTHKYLGIR
jgi:organic radical activating enzyme